MIKKLLPILVVIIVWVTAFPAGAIEFPLERQESLFCFSILDEYCDFYKGVIPEFAELLEEDDFATARKKGRGVVLGMGAHPLKVGLGLHLVDAIEKGLFTGIATNGAAIIHDFELAVAGMTSEDVGAALDSGKFGMAEETAISLNGAIADGASEGNGIGSSVGELIEGGRFEHANLNIFAAATRTKIPATVHVAIGTDIIHMHPSCDGAATGAATLTDFLLLARQVAALDEGVYINLGSAVIMPEVFLKAFSLAKNLGHQVKNLTTINMDFIQHYRPTVNVLQRPTAGGGRGYALTGNHEILLPLLLSAVKELL